MTGCVRLRGSGGMVCGLLNYSLLCASLSSSTILPNPHTSTCARIQTHKLNPKSLSDTFHRISFKTHPIFPCQLLLPVAFTSRYDKRETSFYWQQFCYGSFCQFRIISCKHAPKKIWKVNNLRREMLIKYIRDSFDLKSHSNALLMFGRP